MWRLSPRGQEAINRSVNRRLLIMLGHLHGIIFGKIADLQMTTLPRAMKSSALLTKGGNIDQYLSALASWYVNIHYQSKLLASQYSKNIQRFWHKIAAEVWDWCCGMILDLIETGQVSTLGSAESPSKSSSHLSQSSTTGSDRVPEFHNRHKNDSNQWKIIHRMVCRGNIKMTEPLARPLLPRAARV